jgi:solute carrier family 25 (peroxisomal adenine nucleotide transporter), member 17
MPGSALVQALHHALSGAGGAAISTSAIYPLDLITTRLKAQRQLIAEGSLSPRDRYGGVLDAMRKIWNHEGGLSAFYAGLAQDLAKSVVDQFLFFLFYTWFRAKRLARFRAKGVKRRHLPVMDELLVGAAAGACARAFTTPIANVVTRLQTAKLVKPRNEKGKMKEGDSSGNDPTVREIVDEIRQEKGVLGLWSGYSANLILTLNPSITFFLNTFLERTLVPDQNVSEDGLAQVGAALTFLFAATSKAMATAITYPVQIAKARAQVSHKSGIGKGDDDAAAKDGTEGGQKTAGPGEAKGAAPAAEQLALTAAEKARNLTRDAVFATIVRIARTEGVSALYDGIGGELLKSFLGHGTTMLSKDLVHKMVVKLYFVGLLLLQRYPVVRRKVVLVSRTAAENLSYMRNVTSQEAEHLRAEGIKQAEHLGAEAAKHAKDIYQKGQHLVGDAIQGSQTVIVSQK